MRVPTDMPRRPARAPRNRGPLVMTAVILLVVGTSLRGLSGFFTDFLWFDHLGFGSVWKGIISTKTLLILAFTGVFFVGLWVSLLLADRRAPRFRPLGPEGEIVARYREAVGDNAGRVRLAVSAVFALVAGTGVSTQWHTFLLFRNGGSFGEVDPLFERDISWYVFKLPFLSFVVDWLFVALVIAAIVTAVAYYLNGGIFLQQGSQRVTPQVKAHLSVLFFLLALVKAVDYWLQRFELTFSSAGHVMGAGYTDVHARLPALDLLVLISLAAAVLFLANIRFRGWMLPVIALGLWLLVKLAVGAAYPAFIQSFRVKPNEPELERPFIEDNIAATRAALGIADVEERPFEYDEDLTAGDLQENAETIRNVRLWDPKHTKETYQRLQRVAGFYELADLDVDRYSVDGRPTQVLLSVRELEVGQLRNQSWVNTRLKYTHGFGAIVAPANAVSGEGAPNFTLSNIPPQGQPALDQPRIYFGEDMREYSIVNTDEPEIDFVDADGTSKTARYTGKGGVELSSFVRRGAFFLRFGDQEILISKPIKEDSRIIFDRDIRTRVQKAAPFLRLDADPYPVIIDGRVLWVQDAYTTSSRYPYAQIAETNRLPARSGLASTFGYVRNSVKAVVDAYDGTVTLYVVDEDDPIAAAYQKAFPELFTPGDRMSDELRAHLRYPEDLFRVQTNMYGRYHITDPRSFYEAGDAWEVALDPGSGEVQTNQGEDAAEAQAPQSTLRGNVLNPTLQLSEGPQRMDPAYLLMRLPEEEKESFLLLQPLVPASREGRQQNLTSFMIAKSDPGSYGKLQAYTMPRGTQVNGPSQVASFISQDEQISQRISLLNRAGSQVVLGNLLVIPIKESLLYVRPLYVRASGGGLPELKQVIVVYGKRAEMHPTLQEGLRAIFGEAPSTLEETAGDDGTPDGGGEGEGDGGGQVDASVQSLLDDAIKAFEAAEVALREGDLAEYQRQVELAQDLARRAREQSGASTSTTTTTTPSA